MHKLEELREMLMEELEKCSDKGELSAGSLEVIDKLAHAIKSIDTIMAMEEGGYSNEYSNEYSNARGRGRNARRDSMGRYSRGSYDGSYDDMYEGSYEGGNRGGGNRGGGSNARGGSSRGGYSRRGYSRDDAKMELAKELKEIAMDTEDSEVKQMIHKWIKQVEE